jgi:hypothetical protein
MFRIVALLIIVFVTCSQVQLVQAQPRTEETAPKAPKLIVNKKPITRKAAKDVIPNIELNGGISFTSTGWGVGLQRLKRNEDAEGELWKGFYVDIAQVHHPKEIKSVSKLKNPSSDKGPEFLKYVYGKINVFIPVNIGYMVRKNISARLAPNHIRIHGLAGGGLSIGLLKPYFLNLAKQQSNGSFASISEKYSEANANAFLSDRFIYGYSGFMKGWSEVEIMPGLTSKAALQFEYAMNTKSIFMIEIGGQLNAYLQQVPIMVNVKNNAIFPSMYISVIKGARWFKAERD